MTDETIIRPELTIAEARALARASNLLIEIVPGRKSTDLETATMKIEVALAIEQAEL